MSQEDTMQRMEFSGFWIRLVAFVVDLVIFVFILVFVHELLAFIPGLPSSKELSQMGPFNFLLFTIYYTLLEASPLRATLGKRLVGIAVVNRHGQPLSIPVAFLRNISKIISATIFYAGFIMIGFTQRKQGLHDMISSTYVIDRRSIPVAEHEQARQSSLSDAAIKAEAAYEAGRYREAIDGFNSAVTEGPLEEKHIAMYQQARRRLDKELSVQ